MKRIVFSDEAKSDIRDIPQHEYSDGNSSAGRHWRRPRQRTQGSEGEKRLRVGDHRVRFTEEQPDTLRIHTVKNRTDAYRWSAIKERYAAAPLGFSSSNCR